MYVWLCFALHGTLHLVYFGCVLRPPVKKSIPAAAKNAENKAAWKDKNISSFVIELKTLNPIKHGKNRGCYADIEHNTATTTMHICMLLLCICICAKSVYVCLLVRMGFCSIAKTIDSKAIKYKMTCYNNGWLAGCCLPGIVVGVQYATTNTKHKIFQHIHGNLVVLNGNHCSSLCGQLPKCLCAVALALVHYN